jgi:enoyl-CoA hydratase/carnithine racemase
MAQNQNSAASGPRQVTRFLNGLASARAPLIAAVSGLAVGVGATLLLHCDLVYLSESAVLSTPFVDLALVPEAASSLLLPARVGHARAFAMFALAERVGAAEALSWGLANRVLPEAELLGAARAAALAVCAKPRGALRHAKALMKAGYDLPEVMARENVLFASQLRSEEAASAFAAFAARRRSS